MITGVTSITSAVVEFALDGLSLRHNAIASNIANSTSVGYRPMQVDFESKIAEILDSQSSASLSSSDIASFDPQISFGAPYNSNTNSGGFEMNLAMLNQNVVQYQALIKGYDTYVASVAEAIKEGKR